MTKKDNLAEYILHLWMMEDVVRAFYSDEVLGENAFLSDLRAMMREEGVMEGGHTQIAKIALMEAEEMHAKLQEEATYRAALMSMQPSLVVLKSKTPNPEVSDIEMMFDFLYNMILLRMQKKEISLETQLMHQQVTLMMIYLSHAYRRMREEEQQ